MILDNRAVENSFNRSQYFLAEYENNEIIRDLIIGLRALRGGYIAGKSGGSKYLPRFPAEPDSYYQNRLAMSYLTNFFTRAIESDSGKILANNVMISVDDKTNNDMPDDVKSWTDDVDFDNTNISMYARDELKKAMEKGKVLTVVDYHSPSGRPFFRQVDSDSVLSFKADKVTGRLSYLKFAIDYVTNSEEDGYITIPAQYELTPTSWKISGSNDEAMASGEIIRYRNNGRDRITDEIPVSVMYLDKKGLLLAESPYQTLAELTIEYFQVYSDIKNTMFYALKPLLLAKNVPADFTLQIMASFALIKLPEGSEEADLEWVKVDTGAVKQGLAQLEDIQKRIATFSIDANALRPGTLTATQSSIESAGTNAALRSFSLTLSAHLRRLIEIMYSYTLDTDHDVKVLVEPEFNSMDNDKEMRIALEMVGKQILSGQTAREAAVNRKILPADFSEETEIKRLEKEFELRLKYQDAMDEIKAVSDKDQQESDGLLAGNGEEEVTEKPREA